jgi:DNA-binding PadR family transcriptional regulator
MTTEDPIPLAPRDLLILSVLSEGPLHGYGIVRAVELFSETGVLLDPANLYRALRRMTRDGWVEKAEEEGEDENEGGGARRRSYALTRAGERVLRAEVARLERLLRHVRPVLAGGLTGGHTSGLAEGLPGGSGGDR